MFKGPDSLLSQVLELTGTRQDGPQVVEVMGMFKAMLDALIFFGKGTGPHVNYQTADAVDYLKA